MFSQTKICFTRSQLHQKMTKIRLSQIESSAFKILSYAGPSVVCKVSDHSSEETVATFILIFSELGVPDAIHCDWD